MFWTDTVTTPPAPPAAGIHDIDLWSCETVRVPSFFLYEADPDGGAISSEAAHSAESGYITRLLPPPPPPSIGRYKLVCGEVEIIRSALVMWCGVVKSEVVEGELKVIVRAKREPLELSSHVRYTSVESQSQSRLKYQNKHNYRQL